MISKGKKDAIKLHLNNFIVVLDKNSEENFDEVGDMKGTLEYMPPEILRSQHELPDCSKQDIWAIGIIAYQLCGLELPFKREYHASTV